MNSRRGLQGVFQVFEGDFKGGLRRDFKGGLEKPLNLPAPRNWKEGLKEGSKEAKEGLKKSFKGAGGGLRGKA